MKTLIITSCTGEKKYHPDNQLVQSDFENKDTLPARESELRELCLLRRRNVYRNAAFAFDGRHP